jgi:hypothetical protein
MPTFENIYMVVMITEAATPQSARREQEVALGDVAYEVTFVRGESG